VAAEPRASAPRSARGPAIAGLVFACACWGLSFPLGKALGDLHARLVPGADSGILALGILAPRFVLATLVLGLALRPRWGAISRAEWRLGLGLGAFSGGGVLLQFEAMQHTSATVSAFLTQFYVVLIPLFLALRRRRAPGWHVAASVALVLAGVAVLARLDFSDLRIGRGEAGTIAATVFFTGQILWLGRKEFADCRPGVCTLLMFAVQGAGFVIIAAARAPVAETFGPLLGSGAWWLFMALLTGFSTLAAFLLMNVWQPRITPTEAGLIYCAEPLFTSVWAAFLPGIFSAWAGIAYANEPFTRVLLLGGALITVANVWIQFAPRRS
jgi:drug/metabolite transporter (DMT)-like permease